MPWKVSDVMEQRFRLVERREESGESIAELARRFAISRKTAYKWLERYQPVAEMPFSRPTYFADPSWRFTPRVLPDLPKRRNWPRRAA
jgi:transposase-like protein